MKKLWRRASGIIKDRNSVWMVSLTKKKKTPELEVAVIKATSHDDTFVDYKNAQRVFTWVRTSPSNLIVFLWALTRRTARTRDWIVALKSLLLLHGVLCTKAPGTRKIGRLPFDLSGFNGSRRWARNAFVRAYYTFADLKSVALSAELKEEMTATAAREGSRAAVAQLLMARVSRWQNLLDAILQVKPPMEEETMREEVVVLEAMDCMIIEVFEVYSKICDGIAKALMKIYTDKLGKMEASMALDILQKARRQGQELSNYFEFCRKIGILHETECPRIERIPEEDFVELERIINGVSLEEASSIIANCNNNRAMVVVGDRRDIIDYQETYTPRLKTVITDKWEVFDEDIGNGNRHTTSFDFLPTIQYNPFLDYGGTPSQPIPSLI